MTQNYLAGEGGLHVQPCGPGEISNYLGCHGVGDVAEPKGDITLLYCPDPARTGKFKVKGSFQAAPGPVTTTITTEVSQVADHLETIECPATLYILKNKCGRRDEFVVQPNNRIYVFDTAFITNKGLTNILAMVPDDNAETQQTFDISAHGLIRAWGINSSRITITEDQNINGITSCSEIRCPTEGCGDCQDACDTMYAGASSDGVGSAVLLESTDKGSTWSATATDPFAALEDIQPVTCFKINSSTWRILAGNGTTDVAANATINYSDDGGTTWAGKVAMPGGSNGEYFNTPNSIFALNRRHIWAVTYDSGVGSSINFSEDGGVNWTEQVEDINGVNGLNAVSFADENNGWTVGESGTIARTNDGGDVWSLVADPSGGQDGLCVNVVTPSHIFIGFDDGSVWHTLNGLDQTPTFTQIATNGTFTAINSIKFADEYMGYLVGASAGNNNLERTFDGGYTWETVDQPTNGGLNAIQICTNNKLFYTGDVSGGLGFIGKAV